MENAMNNRIKFVLSTVLFTPVLAYFSGALAQSDQTYATYITEEQWQIVNELGGVDRQIVSRDIGKLNLSVGIIHRNAVERASGRANENPARPCGTTDNSRNSNARGIMHVHQTETYYIASGSGTLVTGGEILNGNLSADDGVVTNVLNGPSCSGLIVGDWVAKRVKEGDIIIIPAGTPHGWLEVPVHVDYLSVRPDPDRVLPDDYINPALGADFQMRTED
jgi:mannose-6-phosphate isomerase-like protein (cupin superfamily)